MSADAIRLSNEQTLRILASGPDALELESTWSTGGKPPSTHWHPRQQEHFEVLEGELTVVVGGDPARVLRAGETIEIPPRTAHRMWNAGAETARATWRVSPALRTEEMFRAAERGRSPLRALKLLWTFRNEYRLGKTRGR